MSTSAAQDAALYEQHAQRLLQQRTNEEAAELLRRGWHAIHRIGFMSGGTRRLPWPGAWWEVHHETWYVMARARVTSTDLGYGHREPAPDAPPGSEMTMFGMPVRRVSHRSRHDLALVVEA